MRICCAGNNPKNLFQKMNFYIKFKNSGGMEMPLRKYSSISQYRYGFNGKEKDTAPVQYDYGFRIYDPRLVRFKSVDPMTKKYPELSPYQFAENSPILFIDLDGLEKALPWYLRENKYGGKPVLTLGLGNLPTGTKMGYDDHSWWSDQSITTFAHNTLVSAWNSIANTWNEAADGKTGTDMLRETVQSFEKVKPSDFKKVSTWEDLAGAVVTIYLSKKLFSFEFSPTGNRTIVSGRWVAESTKGWSARAIEFQEHVTGVKAGNALEVNGVKFDGIRGNTLLEAKNGYDRWVSSKTGEFYNSFKGKDGLLIQARRQLEAANGADIEWHFSNQKSLNATKSLFEKNGIKEGIKFVINPPK